MARRPRRYVKRRIPKSARVFYRRTRALPKMIKGGYWYDTNYKTANEIHHFKRVCALEDISVIPAGGYHRAFQFSLDQLPNFNEWVNLYDCYRIKCIVLRIEPTFTEITMSNPQTLNTKFLRVVHDYDDATPLVVENDYFEYGNMKSYQANRPHKITFYPKVSAEIYRSLIATSYEQRSSPWLDLSATGASIPHYGIKIYFPYLGVNDSMQFRIMATFYVHMKQTK